MHTMECAPALKILPYATTQMDLEGVMLSEISQEEQKLQDSTYMKNLKKTYEGKGKNGSWLEWGQELESLIKFKISVKEDE